MSIFYYSKQIKKELRSKNIRKGLKKLSKCTDKNGRHWASVNRIEKLGLNYLLLKEVNLIKKMKQTKGHYYIVYPKRISYVLWRESKISCKLKKIGIVLGIIEQ